MIIWMLQSLLAAAMIAGAAVAIEEGARVALRPLRWGWLLAMASAAALPPLFRFLLPAAPAPESAGGALDPRLLETLLSATPAVEGPSSLLDRLLHSGSADPLLLVAWGVVAAAMGGALLLTHRRLRRVRASAHPVEIAGLPVLLTHSTGPMVVGFRRPEVVVPAWIGELTETEQRLVLRHEWEHVRAGDTRLLLAGALLVAAMPWNLPLWWMRSRLRQAIEVDCDARVLSAGIDRRLYGTMLIHTAGRPRPAPLLAPALVELPSMLERRIIAMTRSTPSHRGLRFGIAAVLAVLLVAAACELTPRSTTPSPTEPTLAEVLDAEEDAPVGEEEYEAARRLFEKAVVVREAGEGEVIINAEGDTLRISEVRVRTPFSSLSTGSADPLIIMDGERVESLEGVNPNRIQSIQILKDGAATSLYGAEGVNGVVLVTTGEPRPTRVRTPRPATAVDTAEEPVAVVEGAPARARAVAPVEVIEAVEVVGYGLEPARAEGATEVPVAVGYGAATRVRAATAPVPIEGVVKRAETPAAATAPRVATTLGGDQNQPLILVDGERVSSFAELAERFEPGQIASISVIKDAEAAVAIYGSRARHGAVIVTLKK